ncbi:cytochrome bd plastoquinol oxidase subunit 2 apoprotein [Leptolyngbya sp. Heron Island J]|uniref:cytochrome d ubiquinol oxidase subunit II n=1 Tax=Leptolyngbya sp. Heron Island J TaxID=1385935 RepID=UPI0003B9ABE3|nr:cytochrome d ubiquinol oxidase subunit II [Leptolyngbya sp. Heron Island J]ESA37785.1 cytochrome bd plastoquinol oxidase subunit 2 apoprotein [Leptolyngbya sp. Heron Island J]
MDTLIYFLPQIWFVILGICLFLYILLDGFNLGVGILSLTASSEEYRNFLITSLSYVLAANEAWLVIIGGVLSGAFPLAYTVILNALNIPTIMMLVGLIFRAVAFKLRKYSDNKLFWDLAFGGGCLLTALAQGFAMGAIFKGFSVNELGHFTGKAWDWLSWQSGLVALTLIQGYVLIGSTYLILKSQETPQEEHYRTAKISVFIMLMGAVFSTISSSIFDEQLRIQLLAPTQVYLFLFVYILVFLLVWRLIRSLNQQKKAAPFVWTIFIFMVSLLGLGLAIFPVIIPPNITIYEAASSPRSMVLMLIFVGTLIPILLACSIYQYVAFLINRLKWIIAVLS